MGVTEGERTDGSVCGRLGGWASGSASGYVVSVEG